MKYGILENSKFLFIDDDKQKLINTLAFLPDYTEKDIKEYEDDEVEMGFDNDWYVKEHTPAKPEPTKGEQSANREREYTQYVDPITSHITRLKDEEQTPNVITEIEELKLKRTAKVEEIKVKYPYPVEVKND